MSSAEVEAGRSPPRSGPKVSACIISFNEEANIAACIDSVSFCDEVVVVDSFSTDRTAEIAREKGARVVQEAWRGFVGQKNRAVDLAASEWVLNLDCDERVTPHLRQAILERLAGVPADLEGYFISRKLFYLGRWLEHGGWFPEWRLCLFRKRSGRWQGVDPHTHFEVSGKTARIPPGGRGEDAAVILHRSFAGLSHQLKVLDRYTEIQAGELFRSGRRAGISDLLFRPLWRFAWCYVLRAGFLDGWPGLHMAVNHAYAAYMKYAKLWELRRGLAGARAKDEVVPAAGESKGAGASGASQPARPFAD
jgi:glycosyl transferase family 2